MSTGVDGDADTAPQHSGVRIALVPPIRLCVNCPAGARVVGKGGESIRSIRMKTGVSIQVMQDEIPLAMKRRRENLVIASCGEVSLLRNALTAILDRIFDRSGIPDPSSRDRERPYVIDVVVPDRAGGAIVGSGGERVKGLMEELNCNIVVVREPLAGIAAQRIVRVMSRDRVQVEAGVWRIQEILAELVEEDKLRPEQFELREAVPTSEELERQRLAEGGEEVPLRLLLMSSETGLIVGRMGYNINRLRDIAHVSIDDAQAPPFETSDRVCLIGRAGLTERLRVLRLVVADLSSRQVEAQASEALPAGSRPVMVRLLLPAERWEEFSKLLQITVDESGARTPCPLYTETGADVRAHQRGNTATGDPAPLQILELQGTEAQVVHAVWRSHQILEPWESFEVPPPYEEGTLSGLTGLMGDAEEDEGSTRQSRGGSNGDRAGPSLQVNSEVKYQQPQTAGEILRRPASDPARSSLQLERQAPERSLLPAESAVACPAQSAMHPSAQTLVGASTSPNSRSAVDCRLGQSTLNPPGESKLAECTSSSLNLSSTRYDNGTPSNGNHSVGESKALAAYPFSLTVAAPCAGTATFLASDASGISRRAGVKLRTQLAADHLGSQAGQAFLEISAPTAASSALACYLVQVQLWLRHVFESPAVSTCDPHSNM